MSSVEKGRFYWLKLKEDFFEDDAIEWLEEQKNGKEYALFYLKLCLKSLKSNGTLIRRVGTMLVPYDTEKLAEITRSDFDTVVVAMELLKKIGLIEVLDSGAIYIASLADMVGSESRSAERMRQLRERRKNLIEPRKASQCDNNVTESDAQCHREIELEKEIELEIDKERDNESATPILNTPAQKEKRKKSMLSDEEYEKLIAAMPELLEQEPEKEPDKEPEPKKSKPKKHQYGEYKNVLLTDDEFRKLTETYPDYGERIERLSGYMASTGKAYKSHYATIRNWAKRDGEQATGYTRQYKGGAEIVTVNGKQYEKRSDGKYYVPGGNGIAVNPYERDTDSLF